MPPPVLDVRGLRTHFFTARGVVRAVDDVSFGLPRGTTKRQFGLDPTSFRNGMIFRPR